MNVIHINSSKALQHIINCTGNIFLTGPPGAGKSYVMRQYIEYVKKSGINLAITASTGIAAKIIEGTTLHSWAGIGLGEGEPSKILEKIKLNRYKTKKWKKTDILIIDEISMIGCKLWNLLDYIGKEIRKSSLPFGGIKVIAIGDFYQLPPVKDDILIENEKFLTFFDLTICLTGNYRSNDMELNSILNNVRIGMELSKEQHKMLKSRVDRENTKYPMLVSLRDTANEMNSDGLNNLSTPQFSCKSTIYCIDTVTRVKVQSNEMLEKIALSECSLESNLVLKVGAPVIHLVNNKEMGLVNGSIGTIKQFSPLGSIVVQFNNMDMDIKKHMYEKEFPEMKISVIVEQYPLLLAYALTIHRAQGQTLEQGTLLLDNTVWEAGQAYVALSRFKSLDSITLLRYKKDVFKINDKVTSFYENLSKKIDI
jgi:ATP-dependent exoDNAse (exonuclease V) alpha subunit